MNLLRESADDFRALVGAASDSFGFPQYFIEKDYWVTEILRSLAAPFPGSTLIFKGGTSLSKAFALIDRMSEDVDITLVVPASYSIKRREEVLCGLTDRVACDLPLKAEYESSSRGARRYTRYQYAPFAVIPAESQGVLLELGIRGGTQPRTSRSFQSYVARHAMEKNGAGESDFVEFAPVVIDVLGPERTLIEKLAALHNCSSRLPDEKAAFDLNKGARHYYDIAKLLASEDIQSAVRKLGDMAAFVDSVNAASVSARFLFTPRPADGYAESPAFNGDPTVMAIVEPAYVQSISRLVPSGFLKPTLAECLGVVRQYRSLL